MKDFLRRKSLAVLLPALALTVACLQVVAQQPAAGVPTTTSADVYINGRSGNAGSQIGKLVATYRETTDDKERSRITDELTTAVKQEFDDRQEARESELAELEEQVRKLREIQKRRESEKSQIVADRVRQLIREADGLGWGGDSGAAGNSYQSYRNKLAPGRAGGQVMQYQSK